METDQKKADAKPVRKKREKPGSTGQGEYFHINLRPKSDFVFFRYQDVGEKGHLQRLAGRRANGTWDTVSWLISKTDAHKEGNTLVADNMEAQKLIDSFGSKPELVEGDIYQAKDRPNVPEKKKPTEAQQKARLENIKKAQLARKAKLAKKE
jgi:hypothetical protein